MSTINNKTINNKTINNEIGNSYTFHTWPKQTLLESGDVPIAQIAELALREGQGSNPLYRVHRWFARRLGSQFRSILTALALCPDQANDFWETYLCKTSIDGAIVLDPFMGGGTSLIESIRCNARVIGFDIDPVATFITRFELSASQLEGYYSEIDQVCNQVAKLITPLHRTMVDGEEHDVLHHFWVQTKECSKCHNEVELHPHYQLAHSKNKKIQWVFCKSCHAVHELPIDRKILICSCGVRTSIHKGTYSKGIMYCPICKNNQKLASDINDITKPPSWKLFAQEYLVGAGRNCTRHFKRVEQDDLDRYVDCEKRLDHFDKKLLLPNREIPLEGRSDSRPMIHGIRRYSDLFNARQKLHLHLLSMAIQKVENNEARRCLEVAFSEHLTSNCMYTAYAFGYRRTSPLFSIHSYRHITRPVELNPWQNGVGRGTFLNTINKIYRAISFAKAPVEFNLDGNKVAYASNFMHQKTCVGSVNDVLSGKATAAAETRSSENLSLLPSESVDLILTDPPYFDNLSYSELSDFYLAWHQELGIAPSPYDSKNISAPILQNLAVTKRSDEAVNEYQERLSRIFKECTRVLKSDGICVFTYHHNLASAWEALGVALLYSGLTITKVLPMRGEGQGGLHTYKGTIKWDAVLVCRKKNDIIIKGTPVIGIDEEKVAYQEAMGYIKTLFSHKRVGFNEPDFVNLVRALVISKSFLGGTNNSNRMMSDALKNIALLE